MHELSVATAVLNTAVKHAQRSPGDRGQHARRPAAPGRAGLAAVLLRDRRARHGVRACPAGARGDRGPGALRGLRPCVGAARSRYSAARIAAARRSASWPARNSRWTTSKSRNRRPHASDQGEDRRGRARRQQHDRARQPRRLRPPSRVRREPDERARGGQDDAARAGACRAARRRRASACSRATCRARSTPTASPACTSRSPS